MPLRNPHTGSSRHSFGAHVKRIPIPVARVRDGKTVAPALFVTSYSLPFYKLNLFADKL